MTELLIWAVIMLSTFLYVSLRDLRTQREYIYKSNLYIRRLKVMAKVSGVDLEDVYDDRKD